MVKVERIYSERYKEHSLVIDGKVAATAHKFNAIWSVKVGGKFLGIAKTEQDALRTLITIEKQLAKLRAGA